MSHLYGDFSNPEISNRGTEKALEAETVTFDVARTGIGHVDQTKGGDVDSERSASVKRFAFNGHFEGEKCPATFWRLVANFFSDLRSELALLSTLELS